MSEPDFICIFVDKILFSVLIKQQEIHLKLRNTFICEYSIV